MNGRREDYEPLREAVRQALTSCSEVALAIQSTGETVISHFVVRSGAPPNRVSFECGRIIFSVAPSLQNQFLSFLDHITNTDLTWIRHFLCKIKFTDFF